MSIIVGFKTLETGVYMCQECSSTFETIDGCEEHLNECGEDGNDLSKERHLACEILGDFEDFLESKGITKEMLPNEDRDEYGSDDTAIIFGSEYYSLEDEITDLIRGLVNEKER